MFFADGPTTSVSLLIPAAPAPLFDLVTDIALPLAGSEELYDVEWVPPADGPALGARFIGRNRRGETAWETVSEITRLDAPTAYTWRVMAGAEQISSWGFLLTPDEAATRDGAPRTVVEQWVVLGPGRSGLTWAIRQDPDAEEAIIEGRLATLRASMERNLATLAATAAT